MSQYEIEIKSLLGNKDKADELKNKIINKGAVLSNQNKQLNHYFILKDAGKLKENLIKYIGEDKKESFNKILDEGVNVSVRTRDADGTVIFVMKASIGSDSSSNGVSRVEFESKMDMRIDELDQLLLDAGLEYQAKWSRERKEYKMGDINICIDKNAGYGYLAEFEKMSDNAEESDNIKQELASLMSECGVEELLQDRLERMFAYYNTNWQDYYGTDKVFDIL
jgi:predicted adenylyl cyclase CyaB